MIFRVPLVIFIKYEKVLTFYSQSLDFFGRMDIRIGGIFNDKNLSIGQ